MREELRIIVSGGGTGGHIPGRVHCECHQIAASGSRDIVRRSRRADGDAACSGCRLSYQGIADLRFRPQAFAEEYCRAFQDLEKPQDGEEDYP